MYTGRIQKPGHKDLPKQVKTSRQSLETEVKESEPATGQCFPSQLMTSHLWFIFLPLGFWVGNVAGYRGFCEVRDIVRDEA